MILFNTIINFIEAFIFPIYLSSYYDLENKTNFIITSGFIQFIVLSFFTYINQSNYLLTLIIILTNICSILFIMKKITFHNIFIILTYDFIIITTSYIGLFFGNFIFDVFSLNYSNEIKLMLMCIFAKLLLIIFTYFLLKYKIEDDSEVQFKGWKLLAFFQMILVISISLIIYLLVKGEIHIFSLIVLSFLLLLSYVLFNFIMIKMVKLNKENILFEKKLQQEQFNKENVMAIKDIKNEVDAIDHRLFYVIFEIDNLIKNNLEKVQMLLDEYKNIVLKQRMLVNTNNEIFDCLLSLKINELLMNNIDVKTCIFISKNNYYDNLTFINLIMDILNQVKKANYIDIDLTEISDFIKIRFLFDSELINLIDLENYLKRKKITFSLESIDQSTSMLNITLKMGDVCD